MLKEGDLVLYGEFSGEVRGVRPDGSIEVFVIVPQYGMALWPGDRVTPFPLRGSHCLTEKYTPVPPTLDTRGNDYQLPKFENLEPNLEGKRVLFISADGPELPELDVPMEYLKARGAKVELAGQNWIFDGDPVTKKPYRDPPGYIVIAQWLADDFCVKANLPLGNVNVADYDAVFIPGGAWNPDMLRTDDAALKIVREARAQKKLIVSLCHGPQVLINADRDGKNRNVLFPVGTKITGVSNIHVDLENAGFAVINSPLDQPTVYDEACRLLTAPSPRELGPLCEEMGRLLVEQSK